MAPLKVIGAGFGRTGTHSLCLALNKLGYLQYASYDGALTDPTSDPLVFKHNYLHPEDPIDWDKVYEGYDAAVEYPDAKIILTVRSADSWYKSAINTIFKMGDVVKEKAMQGDSHFRKLYDMVYTMSLHGLFQDRADDEEFTKQKFVEHNERVKAIVPPERLLVMELGDGWEKLCPFLGKEIPTDEPYPRGNSMEDFSQLRDAFESGANTRETYEATIGKAK